MIEAWAGPNVGQSPICGTLGRKYDSSSLRLLPDEKRGG